MNIALLAAVISGAVSIVVAVVGFLLTKQKEREADWRKMKLDLYKDYVAALSSQLNDLTTTQLKYVDATNALTLVAPADVLKAVYAFNDDLFGKQAGSLTELIQAMLTALRRDIHTQLRQKSEDFGLRLFRKSAAHTTTPSAPAESN